jgi:hypothetical protein
MLPHLPPGPGIKTCGSAYFFEISRMTRGAPGMTRDDTAENPKTWLNVRQIGNRGQATFDHPRRRRIALLEADPKERGRSRKRSGPSLGRKRPRRAAGATPIAHRIAAICHRGVQNTRRKAKEMKVAVNR